MQLAKDCSLTWHFTTDGDAIILNVMTQTGPFDQTTWVFPPQPLGALNAAYWRSLWPAIKKVLDSAGIPVVK